MTTFDKVKNMLGAAATGILITGLSGGITVPAWLLITAAGVQFATGATTQPMLTKGMLPGKRIPGTNQRIDPEDPR